MALRILPRMQIAEAGGDSRNWWAAYDGYERDFSQRLDRLYFDASPSQTNALPARFMRTRRCRSRLTIRSVVSVSHEAGRCGGGSVA